MKIKPTPHQYFWIILLAFLAACGKQSVAPPTETPTPTAVSPTPTSTAEVIPTLIAPTPTPTQPSIPPMITPDAIQVARWKEYENALAMALFPSSFIPGEFLCEWEILGRSDQEVYVWAVCMSTFLVGNSGLHYEAMDPAVIHIGVDGAVQSVEIPGIGSDYAPDIRRMFPPDVQERYFNGLIDFQRLRDHLRWRLDHTEEPPLVVLSATPTP